MYGGVIVSNMYVGQGLFLTYSVQLPNITG
jgi:hypothetical protein